MTPAARAAGSDDPDRRPGVVRARPKVRHRTARPPLFRRRRLGSVRQPLRRLATRHRRQTEDHRGPAVAPDPAPGRPPRRSPAHPVPRPARLPRRHRAAPPQAAPSISFSRVTRASSNAFRPRSSSSKRPAGLDRGSCSTPPATSRRMPTSSAMRRHSGSPLADGRQFPGELVGTYPANDVAVIKISAPDLRPATFADSSKLEVGQIVMAVGNPLGLQSSVTQGIVSALGRNVAEPGGVDTARRRSRPAPRSILVTAAARLWTSMVMSSGSRRSPRWIRSSVGRRLASDSRSRATTQRTSPAN